MSDHSNDHMAVDASGQSLPYSPDEVKATVMRLVNEGDILAVIVRGRAGDLAVSVFGPPSHEILEQLETVTRAYRRVLRGQ